MQQVAFPTIRFHRPLSKRCQKSWRGERNDWRPEFFLLNLGTDFTKALSRCSKNWCNDPIWKYTHHLSVQSISVLLPVGFGRITVSLALFACQRCLKNSSKLGRRIPQIPGFPSPWLHVDHFRQVFLHFSKEAGVVEARSQVCSHDIWESYISYTAAHTGRYRIVYICVSTVYMC